MRSLIVYGTFKQQRQVTYTEVKTFVTENPAFYVRTETFIGDAQEALKYANPRQNETVLNTIDIPE